MKISLNLSSKYSEITVIDATNVNFQNKVANVCRNMFFGNVGNIFGEAVNRSSKLFKVKKRDKNCLYPVNLQCVLVKYHWKIEKKSMKPDRQRLFWLGIIYCSWFIHCQKRVKN